MNFLLYLPRGFLQFVFRSGVRFSVQQLVHLLVCVGADVVGVGDEAAAFVIGVTGMEALLVHRMGRGEAPRHEGGLNALFHDLAEGYGGVQRVQLDFQAAFAGVFLQLAQRGGQGGGGVGEGDGGGEPGCRPACGGFRPGTGWCIRLWRSRRGPVPESRGAP